jgi:hypothetical protein
MTGDLDGISALSKAEAVMMVPQDMLGQQGPALSNDVAVYWMGRALGTAKGGERFRLSKKLAYLGWMHCVVGGEFWLQNLEARFWLFVDSRYMRRTAFKGHLMSQTKVPKDISKEKRD